ncbi:Epididymal-specific lipocalin-9 [Microtus ochrogaster]|uniref:Epididymal-specific lipocalin-9 n=1 Tax=Microtus ochrogaster TaxID=79684 RepID=A0A8J6G8E2_MICOH|nr:Epididymal-specific lipocalin-9 [Microtus ochrogaster]
MVLLLLLGLVLSLANAQFSQDFTVQRNHNMARISGTWNSFFMASDNMTRIRENGDLRLFIRKISILKNGSLQFDFHFMCVLFTAPPRKLKLGETVFPCRTGTSYTHTPACLGQFVNGRQPFPGDHHDGVGVPWPISMFCAPPGAERSERPLLSCGGYGSQRVQGECVAVTMVCEKTETNGEFTVDYEGENRVRLSETDYRMYVIFYMENIKNRTKTRVLALYGNPTPVCSGIPATGRIPKFEKSYLKRFENICKKYGLDSQNIIDLIEQDNCYDVPKRS